MSPRVERALLVCGVIGPPLFVMVFLLEGAFAPPGYSVLRHPVSSFSIDSLGWIQVANFLVTGALMLAFAYGLRRAYGGLWVPLLVGLFGLGLIGSGIFVTDPLNGYPPGTPLVPDVRTLHGVLHDLFGTPAFLGLPVTCVLVAYQLGRAGQRGWAAYSIATAILSLACFVLTAMALAQTAGLEPIAGLLQRVTIIIGWAWLAALAVRVHRARRPVPTRWRQETSRLSPRSRTT